MALGSWDAAVKAYDANIAGLPADRKDGALLTSTGMHCDLATSAATGGLPGLASENLKTAKAQKDQIGDLDTKAMASISWAAASKRVAGTVTGMGAKPTVVYGTDGKPTGVMPAQLYAGLRWALPLFLVFALQNFQGTNVASVSFLEKIALLLSILLLINLGLQIYQWAAHLAVPAQGDSSVFPRVAGFFYIPSTAGYFACVAAFWARAHLTNGRAKWLRSRASGRWGVAGSQH